MDSLKIQKSDNAREIQKFREINDSKVKEAQDQMERLKGLDYEMART